MKKSKLFKMVESEDEKFCPGIVYKARLSTYIEKGGGYVETMKLVPNKTKSCEGCDNCPCLEDALCDLIDSDRPPDLSKVEDGKFYYLIIINESTDWETGIVDDWELGFTEYVEDKCNVE